MSLSVKNQPVRGLGRLTQAINEFRRLDQTMPSQTIAAFLYVASHPGCTLEEVAKSLGLSRGSASRNIAALSDWHRLKRPGAGVVEAVADPMDMRSKIINLTPKGQQLAESISNMLGD